MFGSALRIRLVAARFNCASESTALRVPPANTRRGFSLLELMIVMAITITVVAMAMPSFMNAFYNIRLKSAASNLSGLMQRARLQAARQNATYTIGFNTAVSPQQAFIDLNNNGTRDAGETVITFSGSIAMNTSGVPTGAGAPPAYVLVGDTAGTTFTNTTTLGYSPRGLPCAYAVGVCATPAPGYFVYYMQDQRSGNSGWAGVVVTRSGRTKPIVWNGAAWQ
jgi:prepilin-type N-terminal cleavage/methylation domain-containing protein